MTGWICHMTEWKCHMTGLGGDWVDMARAKFLPTQNYRWSLSLLPYDPT